MASEYEVSPTAWFFQKLKEWHFAQGYAAGVKAAARLVREGSHYPTPDGVSIAEHIAAQIEALPDAPEDV